MFLDGQEVHSQMVEYRTTFSNHDVLTTIGDYFTNTNELWSPFTGDIDEVHIAGVGFTPEFEAFRARNLLDGSAVEVADAQTREGSQIVISSPRPQSTVHAGLVPVTGMLSDRGMVTVTLEGDTVFSQTLDAGSFSINVPVDANGAAELVFSADTDKGRTQARLPLTAEDAAAPNQPDLKDNANAVSGPDASVDLTVCPASEYDENVTATYWVNPLIPLTEKNTQVRIGTTPDALPTNLTPTSGSVSSSLDVTSTSREGNPYQIVTVKLTDEQAQQDQFHFAWTGSGGTRRVSAWVFDPRESTWKLATSGSDPEGKEFTLDIRVGREESVTPDQTVTLLLWRGLTQMPQNADDLDQLPAPEDYSWAMDHVPDTQLYTQATPERVNHQFQYVADMAKERKTALVVQAGDLTNRPYLSQEYQFHAADEAVSILEDAKVPYLVSWGNHDYNDRHDRNSRVFLPRYFPFERFEASPVGTGWFVGNRQLLLHR